MDIFSAEFIFIWVICILYLFVACYLFIQFCIQLLTERQNVINRIKVIAFTLSLRGYDVSLISNAKQVFDRQDVVLSVMNSNTLQTDIALTILSYLC